MSNLAPVSKPQPGEQPRSNQTSQSLETILISLLSVGKKAQEQSKYDLPGWKIQACKCFMKLTIGSISNQISGKNTVFKHLFRSGT